MGIWVVATFSWLWTFVNKCLFELLFWTLLFLGVEWQGRMSTLCLAFWWTAQLLSTAAAVWLRFSASSAAVPVGVTWVSLCIWFAFSWWLVMLRLFSCVICGSSLEESLFKPFAYFLTGSSSIICVILHLSIYVYGLFSVNFCVSCKVWVYSQFFPYGFQLLHCHLWNILSLFNCLCPCDKSRPYLHGSICSFTDITLSSLL